MWNKRNEDESSKAAAPRPTYTTPPTQPAYTPPAPPPKPVERGGVIGPSMTIKGEVYSREELLVEGEIQGSVQLDHRLTVGPNGKIRANVRANEVVVQGSIQGNVQSSEKIVIREKGSLVGDIKTAGIVIEDGAYFKGSIDITKAEPGSKTEAPAKAVGQAVGKAS